MGDKLKQEDDKFIVINRKRLDELNEASPASTFWGMGANEHVQNLVDALNSFSNAYKDTGRDLDMRYWVCNKDEPYAEDIRKIILSEGEHIKAKDKKLSLAVEALKHAKKYIDSDRINQAIKTIEEVE